MAVLDRRALLRGIAATAVIVAAPALAFPAPITPEEYVTLLEAGGIRPIAWREAHYYDCRGQKPVFPGDRDWWLEARQRYAEHPDQDAFYDDLRRYLIETGRIA